MDINSLKLKQALHILLYGVSCIVLLTFGCSQNKSLATANSTPVTGTWKLDSVNFKTENKTYLRDADIDIKFDSNLILVNNIQDSIGFCYFHSIKRSNTISLLIYFSMYQLKFPYVYQVNSNEAITYFKNGNCSNLKFKTLKFENSKNSDDKLDVFFLKLTGTYEYKLKEQRLMLESNDLKIYLHNR